MARPTPHPRQLGGSAESRRDGDRAHELHRARRAVAGQLSQGLQRASGRTAATASPRGTGRGGPAEEASQEGLTPRSVGWPAATNWQQQAKPSTPVPARTCGRALRPGRVPVPTAVRHVALRAETGVSLQPCRAHPGIGPRIHERRPVAQRSASLSARFSPSPLALSSASTISHQAVVSRAVAYALRSLAGQAYQLAGWAPGCANSRRITCALHRAQATCSTNHRAGIRFIPAQTDRQVGHHGSQASRVSLHGAMSACRPRPARLDGSPATSD